MADLFNLFKKKKKILHFSKLGAELLEKNRALEEMKKSSELPGISSLEKESGTIRKEKILEEKAHLLQALENSLKNKELDLANRLLEIEERISKKQFSYELKLKSLIEAKIRLEQECEAKEQLLRSREKELEMRNELLFMIDAASRHVENENMEGAKSAYEGIRKMYSQLSHESREKIHSDIMKLKDDLINKLHGYK